MNNNESLAHAKRDRTHHIVRMPKYSMKVLYGQVREGVGSVLRQLVAAEGGIAIQEGGVCVCHIHMCLRIAPKHSVAKVMGCLKGKSALIVFGHHPEWRKATGKGRTLWARDYYVSTVGINESVIGKHVRNQEDASRIEG